MCNVNTHRAYVDILSKVLLRCSFAAVFVRRSSQDGACYVMALSVCLSLGHLLVSSAQRAPLPQVTKLHTDIDLLGTVFLDSKVARSENY